MESITIKLSDNELIRKFEEDCETRGLSRRTIEGYVSILNLFSSFLKKKGLTLLNINRDVLRDYISYMRKQGINPKTIGNHFSALSSFYEYATYENLTEENIVLKVRKRYLWQYKRNDNGNSQRKLISVEEMANFINSILDIRDKAIAILLAKTGIRRGELIRIDLDDVNWKDMSIMLKPTHKRSNRVIFFDPECAIILKKWLRRRELIADPECRALFVSYQTGKRLKRNGVYTAFVRWAIKLGLYNPESE